MSVMRNRPKGARGASFGLGLCVFALIPTEIGYQDIASLLARQPGVAERWQKRVFSAASNIQVATYSFGRPIGTSVPKAPTYVLASLDNQGIDITGSVTRNPIVQAPPRYQPSDFPKVDRTLKGDPRPCPARAGSARWRRARERGSIDIQRIGEGCKNCRCHSCRQTRAARSGARGSAERSAACAVRCFDVAGSPAVRRLESCARYRFHRA